MKPNEFIENLLSGEYDDILEKLYSNDKIIINENKQRYKKAVESFISLYPDHDNISVFSAPGRTEIGGNHTDHQHGCVLAAAVNLDIIAIVAFHGDRIIRVQSEGYPLNHVDLSDLTIHENEEGTSSSLVRGIVSQFSKMGVIVEGFDAYTTSNVLGGSGLSSSAAFEVLIGTIIDSYYNNCKAGAVEIAKIGQYAENKYFGKKSGLMDQMVSSVGSFVFIDFEDSDNPKIEKLECEFENTGYSLCITDTKGSHADLTDDYVSVPTEMNLVAAQFGKSHLREVSEQEFYESLSTLRTSCSDRAILRAAHFFNENRRAKDEAKALKENSIEDFLKLVKESGDSSTKWLQNLYSCLKPSEQGIPLGLFASEQILGKEGASRVHGGGFAGTIQAFVPTDMKELYENKMNMIFGKKSCYCLRIRPVGGIKIA